MDRRKFLRSIAGYGVASLSDSPASLFAREGTTPKYFGLHPFIEAHPEAVFIRKTGVPSKDDAVAKRREAFALAEQIFTLRETPGIALTHRIGIKPNLTSAKGTGLTYAIVTDPFVVEGFIEALKRLGVPAERLFVREGLMVEQGGIGYVEMARRSGVHYSDGDSREPTLREDPDGVVFRRTRYLGPFNYPESWILNISKFKTHSMGLTLCVKNLQGTNIPPYIRFCGGIPREIAGDFQRDAQSHVDELYEGHRKAGLPRWDTEQAAWMEMWIQRTLDHYRWIRPTLGLNVIEGVYAQNGDAFDGGPGKDGTPELFQTNLLIFGKDAFRVDIIGHWLAGHEPGNFGLFHIARERGISTALNPRNIPVYAWENSGPKLSALDRFARTPLASPYLRRSDEPRFHLCNEPFVYRTEPIAAALSGGQTPELRFLGARKRPRAADSAVIEYSLPEDGHASLEIFDAFGDRVGVPASGWAGRGTHVAEWKLPGAAVYRWRLRTCGFEQTGYLG